MSMLKRPNVLIVEPRQSARTFLEMTLNQEGVRVYSAVSLDSALLQLRVLQPDLIIVALDGCTFEGGVELARIRVLSQAPVLVLRDDRDERVWPGIAGTLSYPIKAGQLCKKVAGLLNVP
jgi:DNA-binding response OmpR family regulator